MSKGNARREAKPQAIETAFPVMIDSAALDKENSLHVLHVDDDACLLEVSKQILSDENNFEIESVTSVDEAFGKMEKQTFDAVVSDYEMPIKNGLEFLKELRTQKMDIPFILFTGKGREDVAVKALNLGADNYINKNGSPETVYCELADAINKTVERKKSIKLLAKSEAKYRTLVENSLQGISILLAAPLRLVFANEAMGKILGYSSQELMSLSPEGIMGLVYHEDRAAFFGRMENRLRGEPAGACYEFRGMRKDGSIIWMSALANRVDYEGQPAVQGMFLDINENKKTEEILRESEERYRELANSLPDIVFETDKNGKLIFANERAAEISGYSHRELENGLNIMQFLLPEDREKATKNIQRLLSGGIYAPSEYTFVRKNGTTFPALITATPCISKNKLTGLRGLVLDITERKRTEESLEKEKQELNRIIDSSPILIFYKDKEGKFIRVNEAFSKAHKIPKEKILGKTVFDFYSAELAQGMTNDDLTVLESQRPKLGIIEQYQSASGMKWVQTDKVPTFDNNGVATGLVGFAQDITERKKAEEVLRVSEENFHSLIDSMDDLVFVLGFDGIFKNYHQPSHNKELYAAPEEFVGKHFMKVLPPQVAELCHVAMKRIEDSGEIQEFDYPLEMNGEQSWYNARLSPTKDQSGRNTSVTVVVRNITERKKADLALLESEGRLRTIFEGASDGILVVDPKTKRFVFANPRICEITGYSLKELLNLNVNALHLEKDLSHVTDQLTKQAQGKMTLATDIPVLRKDRRVVYCDIDSRPAKIGEQEYLVGFFRDITESKRIEKLLKESEGRLKSVIENSSDQIFMLDRDCRFLLANKSAADLFGISPQGMFGKSIHEVFPEIIAAQFSKNIKNVFGTGKSMFIDEKIVVKGRELYTSTSLNPVRNDSGRVIAVTGSLRDITERKNAEEKLANFKEFDERIIDSLDDALLVIDPDNYKIISSNEAALKQLNLRKEELIGKTCYQTTHHLSTPCQSPEHDCPIRMELETKEIITVEHKHLDEKNNERIVEVSARLVKNPEGKTVVIHVARDITERKQMETRIREAEKRYRTLFNQAPVGILVFDAETAVPVDFNEVAHQELGYSREEFAKLRVFDYKAVETPDETRARIEKVLQEGRAEFETKHRTKNGEVRDVIVTSQAIEWSGRKFVLSIYRDVTEAKKIEIALMESEAKYRQLVELAQEGVWALNNDSRTVFVNTRMANMLGYSESEMIGKNLASFTDNSDSDLAKHNLEECKLGNQGQCEFEFTQKDGAKIYANIAASSIQDDAGNSIGTLALVADTTERKKIEINLKESRDRLEMMNEKLRVVGSLTRHDVSNKLSAVTGYAYILKKKHADQADILDGLVKMDQAVKEIVKIFNFAKMYEQLGVEALSYVEVERAVADAVVLFSGLTFRVINECQGLTVLADSFLSQLFFNFIDNTRKYGKKTTAIRVYFEKAEQNKLRLIYEDDGVGISVEDKLNLFKEGFSTGGSTGFGLFLSKKMMNVYGWEIQEVGEPGKGAKFAITIPRISQSGKENFRIA